MLWLYTTQYEISGWNFGFSWSESKTVLFTAFKDTFILSLGRKLWTWIDLRLCSYSEHKNERSRFGEKLESVFFLPSEIFSIHSFFFQKILRSPPEKPPAFPTAVYKWWVQLEASVLGSALYAYVARVRRRRPKQFVFSVCADYTNDLDHTWPGPAVTLATYRPE